jgi:phage shock protein C
MEQSKKCQACRMNIPEDATRCGHCRSWQAEAGRMHRSGDRLFAGVCGGVAQHVGLDPTLVRILFAITIAMSGGLALSVYVMLWVVTPYMPNDRPPLTRWADTLADWFTPRRADVPPDRIDT